MIRKLFLLFFLLVACSSPQNGTEQKVLKVIDGDTIKLSGGKLLRYIGIDTPEVRIKKKNNFVYSPQPFALEAKEYNQQLVLGKTVKIEYDIEKKDRYGRILGYCYVDGVFINAKLLEEGYAVVYTYPPNVKHANLFYKLQTEAREQNKGLWGSYEIIFSEDAQLYVGQIKTVRGYVKSTYQSSKCVFLNFGEDWQTDFTVVVFNNSIESFRKKGVDPLLFYRGKLVEITGRIREYNGPEIIVNTPEEIMVVNSE